jgi:adenosylcobinamide-phosphate synthase
MVSRDTDRLDVAGVVRAATESVAENTVDGVAAPLLYAVLGGAPLAVAYKAASTLDSTFGYRTERYRDFGWAAARLDDAAACLPARATPPFVALAAILCRERPLSAWRICRRDGRRHASPNAGLAEAAFAGALGVQLGGPAMREGQWIDSPLLGDPRQLPTPAHITRAVRLMYVCTALQAATLCAVPRLRQWRRTCARFSTPQEVR